ncbi:MAG: Fe-S cluster assembly ATPase SufC [Acidimicrobiales bacterium]
MSELVIEGLHGSVGGREILHGLDLTVRSGEVHAVMGPNGSGKSTLSHVLAGKPGYEVTAGRVTLDGADLFSMEPYERAQAGLLLVLQYPIEVPGVLLRDVMSASMAAAGRSTADLDSVLAAESARIGLDIKLLDRGFNVDLSGGERKRNETLQMAVLRPTIAVLDEVDSGLDIDALRAVARRIEAATTEWDLGVLAITHYSRLLHELHADHIHVLVGGRIVESGGPELAERLESEGYKAFGVDEGPAEPPTRPAEAGVPFADPFA